MAAFFPRPFKEGIEVSLLILLMLPFFYSCSSEPDTPEAQIRRLIESAETAAEAKKMKTLKNYISEGYKDGSGHNKKALSGFLTVQFFRNKKIHLLTRIHAISFPEPQIADVTLFVAMSGSPFSEGGELPGIRADLYRFDFKFSEESSEEWKLVSADWRRAEPDDFI